MLVAVRSAAIRPSVRLPINIAAVRAVHVLSRQSAPLSACKSNGTFRNNNVSKFQCASKTFERSQTTSAASYKNILTETRDKVAIITLNRPKALNALNSELISELIDALGNFDRNPGINAIVVTGSTKAFAAGADIKEMATKTFMECFKNRFIENWGDVASVRKPVIAAVNGFALGGGCELAMMCDIIYAGDNAKFGQPEIALGVIPGGGGTQRLIRAVGKSRAMEMILSGDQITAQQALAAGLVSKVFPPEETLDKAIALAQKIATFSQPATIFAKETINQSYELSLEQGLKYEVRAFWSLFATKDQKEGMSAFAEKRPAKFTNE